MMDSLFSFFLSHFTTCRIFSLKTEGQGTLIYQNKTVVGNATCLLEMCGCLFFFFFLTVIIPHLYIPPFLSNSRTDAFHPITISTHNMRVDDAREVAVIYPIEVLVSEFLCSVEAIEEAFIFSCLD